MMLVVADPRANRVLAGMSLGRGERQQGSTHRRAVDPLLYFAAVGSYGIRM